MMMKYNPYEMNTIVIEVAKSTTEEVLKLLRYLKWLGGIGASRTVESSYDKSNDFQIFFDGDGNHKIGDITVNGLHLRELSSLSGVVDVKMKDEPCESGGNDASGKDR